MFVAPRHETVLCAQDSARLRLFCESVLVLCVAQPDPALNPAAHLLGVVASGSQGKEKGSAVDSSAAAAAAAAAGRLRLKRLLAACVGYFGKELNQVGGKKAQRTKMDRGGREAIGLSIDRFRRGIVKDSTASLRQPRYLGPCLE